MIEKIWSLVSENLGIDLGTSNTYIYAMGKGILVREPTVVARNKKSKEIVAVGREAKKMIGRTPSQLETVRPLKEGVISDFDAATGMLAHYFKILHPSHGWQVKIPKPKVVVGIPTCATEVERKAVQDAALTAGARKAFLIEEPMAVAIGAGLPIFEPVGALIVDIGGGTTDLALISLGGIVISRSLKVAGEAMDEAIINYLRLKYSLLVGLPTAESLKIEIGSAKEFEDKKERQLVVRGRDLSSGLPQSIRVSSVEVREAISPLLSQILAAITGMIEESPPELLGDITQKGIYLSGGVSLLPGLDKLVTEATGIACYIVKDPLTAVVRGCGRVLEDEKLLNRVKITGGVK